VEFRVAGTGEDVVVDSAIAAGVLARLDPTPAMNLDPYADDVIAPGHVGALREAAGRALDRRAGELRDAVAAELRLRDWPSWADDILATRLDADEVTTVLRGLGQLCDRALAAGRGLTVHGD
jgi:hypothetical protein